MTPPGPGRRVNEARIIMIHWHDSESVIRMRIGFLSLSLSPRSSESLRLGQCHGPARGPPASGRGQPAGSRPGGG